MKALTVRPPWSWAITYGGKTTENRTRRTHYRGPLAIHAGQTWDERAADLPLIQTLAGWNRSNVPTGAVVAVAELVDCHPAARPASCCQPWGEPEAWHWVLANVRPLVTPVPCRGHLYLFDLPAEMAVAVAAQFEAVAR